MQAEEFLQEVLKSNLCPPEFQKSYTHFQSFQKLADDTLLEFHRVCEKNHIPYQLTYGSLLGAVRDGGQIPWDYDVDVMVPYEERNRLVDALKRDLDPKYYFYCPEVNRKCRHFMMRLAPVGYRTESLHVDVFYLTGVPEGEDKNRVCADIKKMSQNRYYRLVKYKDEWLGWKTYVIKFIGKVMTIFCNTQKQYAKLQSLCSRYPLKTSKYCATVDIFAGAYIFKTSYFMDTKLIETNIGELRIPVNYEPILEQVYGDYMKVPPLDVRIREMMSCYATLKRYAKKDKEDESWN